MKSVIVTIGYTQYCVENPDIGILIDIALRCRPVKQNPNDYLRFIIDETNELPFITNMMIADLDGSIYDDESEPEKQTDDIPF
jgi:hypothetical protein